MTTSPLRLFGLALLTLTACDPGSPPTFTDAGRTMRDAGGPTECPPGQTFCNGRCIPTATNPLHCGACGNVCASDETCEEGTCRGAVTCSDGQRDCGGGCTDVSSNPEHCGRCGEECASGASCRAGACVPDVCPTEQPLRCGETCVDPEGDNSNCGACAARCGVAESCSAGRCVTDCEGTTCEVDGANVCVDINSDPAHCGGCNTACAASEECSGGRCACSGETTSCGGACVDTVTDPAHCGGCGNACEAGAPCVDGRCACPSGLTECGGECVNTDIDDANCGGCGTECSAVQACAAGGCVSACEGGLVECGDACVDTSSDPAHCGGCSRACDAGLVCASGVCRPDNDGRAGAIALSLPAEGAELTVRGTTDGATPDLPTLSCAANGPNVWYSVTVPAGGGVLWVDTQGSGYDTALFVTDDGGTEVSGMCNDDCGCNGEGDFGFLESCAASYVSPGTYFISVGGYSASATGDFTLHVQFLRDIGFTYPTRLNGTGSTLSTVLIDSNDYSASCGGSGTVLSGEDMRWFASCGGSAVHHFSVCPEDGGSWTRTGSDGELYDPVLAVQSAFDGAEAACSDDDFGVNCEPEGGGPSFGSRIRDLAPARGVHGVIVDSRGLDGGGMVYSMRYEVPELEL